MGFFLSSQIRRDAAVSHLRKNCGGLDAESAALPVTAPVPVVPVAAMPAPMTSAPAPVTVVPVVAPAHPFGLEAVHLVLANDRWMGSRFCRQPFIFRERMRRKR